MPPPSSGSPVSCRSAALAGRPARGGRTGRPAPARTAMSAAARSARSPPYGSRRTLHSLPAHRVRSTSVTHRKASARRSRRSCRWAMSGPMIPLAIAPPSAPDASCAASMGTRCCSPSPRKARDRLRLSRTFGICSPASTSQEQLFVVVCPCEVPDDRDWLRLQLGGRLVKPRDHTLRAAPSALRVASRRADLHRPPGGAAACRADGALTDSRRLLRRGARRGRSRRR